MARYAIGDIQGCYNEFIALLQKICFNPSNDTLYLVGDLINRGPESLKVLRYVYKHQNSIITVLGNHDIFLIGRYAQVVRPDANSTIDQIINAHDAKKLIEYLRNQPLIFDLQDYILIHAGVHPSLKLSKLLVLNKIFSECMQAKDYANFIENIYGNKPNIWSAKLSTIKQVKFVVNSSTRMRFIEKETLAIDYKYKGNIANSPNNLTPWFLKKPDASITKTIVFGHWASLGFMQTENFIALDTGCVWGNKLTAINMDSHEIIQINSLNKIT